MELACRFLVVCMTWICTPPPPPPPQLTGWTSNLVDIVMAHHFSTVSLHLLPGDVFPSPSRHFPLGRNGVGIPPLFYPLQDELTENQELIQTYRLHIAQDINQDNLALFCGSYQ